MNDYPLRIEVRPLLTCGGTGYGPGTIFILLADDLDRAEATATLWHEIVHILKKVGGGTDNHDEAEVDAIAKKLAAACPEVLELCGVAAKFKMVPERGLEPPRLSRPKREDSAIRP